MHGESDGGKKEKLYHHEVLEAKIMLGDSIVISLGTEYIEYEKLFFYNIFSGRYNKG